jgi:chromosome segregation ATPase
MARAFGRGSPESGKPELEPPPRAEPPPSEPISSADAEWLDAAIHQFESRMAEVLRQAGDEMYAQVERDLARTEERLRETEERIELNVAERLEGAVAEVRVRGDAQIADEIQRVKETAETPLATIRKVRAEAVQEAEAASARADKSATKAAAQIEAAAQKLGVRVRRQELKLVREETSKRMTGALERLERQAEVKTAAIEAVRAETGDLLAQIDERVTSAVEASEELERRLAVTGERLTAAETRAEATASMVAEAMERLEDAMTRVEDAAGRLLEVSERAGSTAKRIAELGEIAEQAVDWEGRMAAATRTEADAAQRITEAERRLLDRIDPGGSSN